MELYEKYLISEEYRLDEAMTAPKALKKVLDKLKNASTRNDVVLAGKMVVQFIKLFPESYTDDIQDQMTELLSIAKKRVGM